MKAASGQSGLHNPHTDQALKANVQNSGDLSAGQLAIHGQRHAMTIDVEEHFQVWALSGHYQQSMWDDLPSRVVKNTERLLDALEERGQRATFFTLGWVAERQPNLIRRIVEGRHEIASHGFMHEQVYDLNEVAFRHDVRAAKAVIEDAAGVEVIGYRAPSFSIGARSPWAHRVLFEEGYRYSSSFHPVANDHYGGAGSVAEPTEIDGILEIPVSTLRLPLVNRRMPCAGGGYFRLLPSFLTSSALEVLHGRGDRPIMFYLHPWEVDPDQPRPKNVSFKTRIRHYNGLDRCFDRFCGLLDRYEWRPADELHGFRAART